MDYSGICYTNSCLSQVIIRIDFLQFLDNEVLFNPSMEETVMSQFPKKGMQQLIRFGAVNMAVNPSGTEASHAFRDGIQQDFSDFDKNILYLSNKFVIFEINNYTTFDNKKAQFEPILRRLMSEEGVTAVRTGIRYINLFGENKIKVQKNFFPASIAAMVDGKTFDDIGTQCIRAMALNEYVIDDLHLNFRYGLFNHLYPQPIKMPEFTLDFDCFCDEPIKGFESMAEHINRGHDLIQRCFEKSISESLRKVMR